MAVPASLGTSSVRLIAFAGDATNILASISVPVLLYQEERFAIWGAG